MLLLLLLTSLATDIELHSISLSLSCIAEAGMDRRWSMPVQLGTKDTHYDHRNRKILQR